MIPQHYGLPWCDTVQLGIKMPKFTYVIRTNKIHTSYIVLILVSSTCFEHPSVHPQEDLYVQFYGISFMLPYKQSGRWPSTGLIIWKCAFCWLLLHRYIPMHGSKNVKYAEASSSNLRPHLKSFCHSIHFLKLKVRSQWRHPAICRFYKRNAL